MTEPGWQDDLSRIRALLKEELELHPALEGTNAAVPEPILAATFLSFYALGAYEKEPAIQGGLALELLERAVSSHYPEIFERGGARTIPESIDIITGDFFYSRALIAVARLNDSQVVRILAQAIASIAEAISKPLTIEAIEREDAEGIIELIDNASALFRAAAELAAYLGRLSEEVASAVALVARGLGGLYYLTEYARSRMTEQRALEVRSYFLDRAMKGKRQLEAAGYSLDLDRLGAR